MKKSFSLRLRVTLVCGILLAVCCLLLTISHNYYAYEMADAIEAIPIQPAQEVGTLETSSMEQLPLAQTTLPARETFRAQSLIAMGVIVAAGCLMVYWLTGKALSPLHQLDEQIRNRTAEDLEQPLPIPASGDEVAGLTVSFNQMSQNLCKAFQRQKYFSQCAAHELRTPLSILKTRMALFRKKGLCATPETDELLKVLEDQTQRLTDLVSDLLALANMDDLECRETIDLPELLSDTADSLLELARQHKVAVRFQTEPGTVLGNRTLLERAFFNLTENAIKYNRTNGTVTIRTVREADAVRVEIADEGPGIPQELRKQIFEPFFRIDKSRSRQLGGAGLGLSLVRAIAELHNGSVWAEAAPSQGSCLIMVLPCPKGDA